MADERFRAGADLEALDDAAHVEFLAALERLRREAGLTKYGLAVRAGFSRSSHSGMERGQDPRLTTIIRYAGALGVLPSALAESAPATPRPLLGPYPPSEFYTAVSPKIREEFIPAALSRFGENLRAVRRATGASQDLTSARTGFHRTEISLLERGGRNAGLRTLRQLCAFFSTTVDQLAEGISWPPGPEGITRRDPGAAPDVELVIATVEQRFGFNLRRLRQSAPLSRAALARRSGLTIESIGKLERGRQQPKLDTIIRLAAVFGVKPSVLLAGISWTFDPSLPPVEGPAQVGSFELTKVDEDFQ